MPPAPPRVTFALGMRITVSTVTTPPASTVRRSEKRIKERAKKEGQKVTLKPSIFELGGTEIYVHPKGTKPDHEKHFVMWAMELTEHCCC